MKKVLLSLLFGFSVLVAFGSCQNAVEQREFLMVENKKVQFASLTLSNSYEGSRRLDVSEIKYASIRISGYDISKEEEPHLDYVEVDAGKNKDSITIENVPVGVDRIVTVKAFDSNKKELPNFNIRAVTDINSGNNNKIQVSKKTTAFGNVLYGIKELYNFKELETDGRMNTIRAVIDDSIHPSLYNSSKLIGELQGLSFPYSAKKEDYRLETGSVTFNYLIAQKFNVSINDPISAGLTEQTASNGIKIEDIVPGNWILTVTSPDGTVLDRNEIQIESGKKTDLGHLEHDGIAILMRQGKKSGGKEYNHIHYWNAAYDESVPENERLQKTDWPGIELTEKITVTNPIDEQTGEYDSDHQNFYLFDFKKASSVKVLITNGNGQSSAKYCTDDMQAAKKGVYCVHSTGLNAVTKQAEAPDPITGLNITQEHLKKCFIDDPKNKQFVILFSEELYGSKPSSVKVEFNRGINDHNGSYAGTHYTMTRNSKGFWYCSVPYIDVQATNQCGQPSYNFKVNDSIINPPSYVPDGYIYQKFTGSQAQKKFLCLIYSSQNEEEICTRLTKAKRCKKLSDFDLNTAEGQKQISNFRQVPGTQNLYRSFHPIKDDKKDLDVETSKARMKYVDELSTKAGIKADINLSDKSQTEATYYIPDYYQKIIKNNAVLYMTDCSYSQCYETPDSSQFAGGIKKIIKFINEKEGPYQIHCAIGTDRTGVVCAVLAGLCGATWNQIQEDYCKSIEMGIYEYRGPGAVKYSLQKFLGVDFVEDVEDLQKALTDKLIEKGISKSDITTMVNRLK